MHDWNEAAVLVQVVQAGSLSAAARQLGVPTSTISTRLARLERRVGVTLLQRTTRRLALTEAGQTYYAQAALGLGYLQAAEDALDANRQQVQGRLKVTAPADLGDALLAGIVANMQMQYPAVQLELWLTDRYVDLVAEGVDVAIRTGNLPDSSLIAKGLGRIQWALFASPSYLQTAAALTHPSQLSQHRCIQFTPLSRQVWELRRGAQSVRLPLADETQVNSIGVVRALVEQGRGVGMLPTYLCQTAVQAQQLVHVLPEWWGPANPLHLVTPNQRFMPAKLRAFIDLAVPALSPLFASAPLEAH